MKRKAISLWRIFKAGGKNFFRNAWLSVAATAVMVVALTIILLAIVLNATARGAIKELSKNLKVSVYLKEDTKEEDRVKLQQRLSDYEYSASVTFISADEARQQFTERFAGDEKLIEGLSLVGGETLPASLEVSVTDLSKINDAANIARATEFESTVESITLGKTDAKKTIERAASAQSFIVTSSILAASIFGAVSVLIIFNTIRMAIFTRSDEIRIMKLIGATPNFIRGPFIVEASIYGLIAGCIANAAVYALILSLGSKVSSQAEFAETYAFFIQPTTVAALLLGAIVAGVLIGVISSMLAMERYLRLKHW